ncbi:hypothetical protein PoB_006727300 [Plakobranchus ocellatus]|uniref:Uncharacterized protein n=1 Tax=Plakobranchus ocellatus TaxID=259542 RepID=A0AAV4D948_9GAST|nr:hypothetical protein PoB_006727300 [Plakobranchus ocellatus]
MQGTVQVGRRRSSQRKRWDDDIKNWSGLELGNLEKSGTQRRVEQFGEEISHGTPTSNTKRISKVTGTSQSHYRRSGPIYRTHLPIASLPPLSYAAGSRARHLTTWLGPISAKLSKHCCITACDVMMGGIG